LRHNDLIKVTLAADSTTIEEPVQKFHWNGKLAVFLFEVKLPERTEEMPVRFKVRVFVNGVPAGNVIFSVTVRPNSQAQSAAALHQEARAFRRPFLSYASQDRAQVLRAAQLISALRMEYFQDILSLEPGEQWQKRLFSEIDKCDLFLLFWSQHARDSKWVVNEAEYALLRSNLALAERPIEIVPVLLEGPPAILPPPSLEGLHFNDSLQYIIFAEESAAKSKLEKVQRQERILANLKKYSLPIVLAVLLSITAILLILR
jgi:hypothetical protein